MIPYSYLTLIFGSAACFPLGAMIKCNNKKRWLVYLIIVITFSFIAKKCYDLTIRYYPPFIVVLFIITSLLVMYFGYKSEIVEG